LFDFAETAAVGAAHAKVKLLDIFVLGQRLGIAVHDHATYGYILENGRVVMDGDAKALAENEDVKEFYLGVSGDNRRSFREVKQYRRRKRWLA